MIQIVSMTWGELKELLKALPDDHLLQAGQTLEDVVLAQIAKRAAQ